MNFEREPPGRTDGVSYAHMLSLVGPGALVAQNARTKAPYRVDGK